MLPEWLILLALPHVGGRGREARRAVPIAPSLASLSAPWGSLASPNISFITCRVLTRVLIHNSQRGRGSNEKMNV